ncbi:MAG TPA: class I SAM-dependent methyltransferase [Kofleriaceae bacterium]|nr:class I SAM-dependent methyltransferase [Kofleriaceae bacterium]
MTAPRDGAGADDDDAARPEDGASAARRRQVAADYDAGAAGYDARHGDRVSLARGRILDAPLVDAARGAAKVLELGVGTGRLLAQLEAPTRAGVDIAAAMLARARARDPRLLLAVADAAQLPFADESFDAVLAGKGVLRYLDPDRALAEAARVLRPGGALAVHLYGARTWTLVGRRPTPAPGRWELASTDDLVDRAAAHGLSATAVHRYRPIRLPPYLLPIPACLDRRLPAQLWGHCVAVFRRDRGHASQA